MRQQKGKIKSMKYNNIIVGRGVLYFCRINHNIKHCYISFFFFFYAFRVGKKSAGKKSEKRGPGGNQCMRNSKLKQLCDWLPPLCCDVAQNLQQLLRRASDYRRPSV